MPATEPRLRFADHDDVVVVVGEIDAATAPQLHDRLAAHADDQHVRVDLSGVSFMDSSGLGILLRHHTRMDAALGRLELARCSDAVLQLLRLATLDQVLHVDGAS